MKKLSLKALAWVMVSLCVGMQAFAQTTGSADYSSQMSTAI